MLILGYLGQVGKLVFLNQPFLASIIGLLFVTFIGLTLIVSLKEFKEEIRVGVAGAIRDVFILAAVIAAAFGSVAGSLKPFLSRRLR
jgi:hypothetical protein